eukprot:1159229-Pelagomonas_calceolata.AAC.4
MFVLVQPGSAQTEVTPYGPRRRCSDYSFGESSCPIGFCSCRKKQKQERITYVGSENTPYINEGSKDIPTSTKGKEALAKIALSLRQKDVEDYRRSGGLPA